MNKMIIFPLFIMIMITLVSFFGYGQSLPDDSDIVDAGGWDNKPTGSEIYYWHDSSSGIDWLALSDVIADLDGYYNPNGPYEESPFRLVNLDSGEIKHYDGLSDFYSKIGIQQTPETIIGILDTPVFWAFIIGGIVVAVAFGLQVFGSGMSEYSQRLTFIGVVYGGVWTFLTFNSTDLLNDELLYPFGWLIYVGLTLMFIFGIVHEMQEAG